jgi:hypothetical protein
LAQKFDITKTEKIIFIGSDGRKMTVVVDGGIEKQKSIINDYRLSGHVGKTYCSGGDVSIDFRSLPNECRRKYCCEL